MPAVALSRADARVVESGPEGENLAASTWRRLEELPDPRSPQGRIYPLAFPIALASSRPCDLPWERSVGYSPVRFGCMGRGPGDSFGGGAMSSAGAEAGAGIREQAQLIAAAQDGVREVVATGASGHRGRRWMAPVAAAAAVAAGACTPVVWPLLEGGSLVGAAMLTAAFTQVGGVGSGLLSEAVIRAWDRTRKQKGSGGGQDELRKALAAELTETLTSTSPKAAGLRAEVAGVLLRVDAVKVALTATIETTAEESAEQVREALIRGLRDLGMRFAEFGWLLEEVSDQLTQIVNTQAELAAGTRTLLEGQQQTSMHLVLLRQEIRAAHVQEGGSADPPSTTAVSPGEERAAALEASGIPATPLCPYPGLAAYQPQDTDRFFGRKQLTGVLAARLAEQLARPGLLIVLGPSGSGKSSLLRAGLLPEIAAGALPVKGSEGWPLDLMTPGRHPLLELATRIASLACVPAGALEADLRANPERVTAAIHQALLTQTRRQSLWPGSALSLSGAVSSARLVLIVDQFEELFTQCGDEQERRDFIRALCAAAGMAMTVPRGAPGAVSQARNPPDARALVVIGIRADFYARSAAYPELLPYLQDGQILVGPMDEDGLRAAIEGPAASAGLVVDADLVQVLLSELGLRGQPAGGGYEAGRLPLLGYALQQTWQHREGRRLTLAAYQATGGIDGAVARTAEALYEGFDGDGRQAVRRLLLRMVSLGEGIADTRRRVTVTELTGASTLPELARSAETPQAVTNRRVLTNLVQARLVTADLDTGGTETVQISHEALLLAWPRLRSWLSQDRAGQRIHRDLTEAAHSWQAKDRDPSHLFGGTRLALTREWAYSHEQDLNADERDFLAACQRRERRGTWRRRTAVAALVVLMLVSAGAAGLAFQKSNQALSERNQAIANQVVAESESIQNANPSLAAQLDLVAHRLNPTSGNTSRLLATANTPLANPLPGATNTVSSVAYSPDGHTLAAGDGVAIRLWNLADPAHPTEIGQLLIRPTIGVNAVAFSPDGHILVAGTEDDIIGIWNVTDPAHATLIRQFPAGSSNGSVQSIAFSPNGQTLAVGNDDGTVRLWSVANLAHIRRIAKINPVTGRLRGVYSVAFSPDGHALVISDSSALSLWNVTDPARATQVGQSIAEDTTAVAFSPDGRTLAVVTIHGAVQLWNITDPAHLTQIAQPLPGSAFGVNSVNSVAFSPDGHILAVGYGSAILLLNVTNPAHATQIGQPLPGSALGVNSVAFSPDGHSLAVGYGLLGAQVDAGAVWIWSIPPTVLTGLNGSITSVAFSPDGHTLAAYSDDGAIQLWSLTNRAGPTAIGQFLTGYRGIGNWLAFDPDGHTLAVGGAATTIRLWNLTNPSRPTQIQQPLTATDLAGPAAFSPDGHILAAAVDRSVGLWNVADPAHGTAMPPPHATSYNSLQAVAFSPDGHILAGGFLNSAVWLWRLTSSSPPTKIGQTYAGAAEGVGSAAFSPDGHILAVGYSNGTIWLWNISNPAHFIRIGRASIGPTSGVFSVAFTPNGHTLITGSSDNTIRLWKITNPVRPTQIGQPFTDSGDIYSVTLSPDGHTLATGSDNTVWLWNLDVDQITDRICASTSNVLTQDQWAHYVPQMPYDPPCRHV